MIYELAGQPDLIESAEAKLEDKPGTCIICAQHEERTARAKTALGTNYTDRTLFHAPYSDRVCGPCLWCVTGPTLGSLRPWSIIATPGNILPESAEKAHQWVGETPGLCLTNRANTKPIINTLMNPPEGEWAVTIAESGQKHVLPYGTINKGKSAWTIRMDSINITCTPKEFTTVFQAFLALRRAGHKTDDIQQGAPTLAAINTEQDLQAWQENATKLQKYSNSPLLHMTGWLITKGIIENDHHDTKTAPNTEHTPSDYQMDLCIPGLS